MRNITISRRARWATPVAVAGAIALGSWIPTVTASAATPKLPNLTASQVVAKVMQARVQAFSGSLDLTTNLGLPSLSAVTSGDGQSVSSAAGFDPTTLLSGTHQVEVWVNGAKQQRLALPSSSAETDFVHNGDQAWLYDSSTQKVTHLVAAPSSGKDKAGANRQMQGEGTRHVAQTPQQVAQRLLSHLTPSTAVTVASPVYVAGRPTYQLDLAPKPGTAGAATSTVSQVAIDVDSATGMPLAVSVHAKGQKAAAVKLGFTSVSFSAPSPSEFQAPTGTSVKTETVGGASSGAHHAQHHEPSRVPTSSTAGKPTVTDTPWAEVATLPHVDLGSSAGELNAVTTPVTGKFGTARLLTTSLVNALIFPNGKVVVGLVNPAALEAAAAG